MVGCAAHRWQLELKQFSFYLDGTLKKLDKLYALLRQPKRTLFLCSSNITDQRRNATRWTSMFTMCTSYFKMKNHIKDLDNAVVELMLTPFEESNIRKFMQMTLFQDLTSLLQGQVLSL
ncbi:hypothetical protein GEMRC1_010505 [Eukaryota sp. GEM-RC1]